MENDEGVMLIRIGFGFDGNGGLDFNQKDCGTLLGGGGKVSRA